MLTVFKGEIRMYIMFKKLPVEFLGTACVYTDNVDVACRHP